ncbi:hypothetical protein RchiOBHm_Chr2g0130691 [Rosa chinensis]|uniref:COBRA-like protein n=1 Tax=Rosa chinensis TaxID=74649 RepID=A0A2P6RUW0_ROSCH|nr:hypothetical protein RchiOBHm_Chr2g0130691 [Rosa chinensis]
MTAFAEAYDPLDPNGKITIRWDIMNWAPDGYEATITMFNFQKYWHIEQPGWTLGWTWAKKEFIWSMLGGKTIDRGDCSSFTGPTPHCCKMNPKVVDLLPDVGSCCRGGVMSSLIQDTSKAVSRFQITVGGAGSNNELLVLCYCTI